jgi:MYXO-CTERM domain-containing protein
MTRQLFTIALGLLVLAAPLSLHAESRPYNPTIEWRPSEFPWESGYVPADGPLRVNLHAAAFHEVLIGMQGQAEHDWDARTLAYHGLDDTGMFRNTLGAEITATIAIDALGFQQEFEVGVWDIAEIADEQFTPYLLPGNPERPVTVAEMIGPIQLANQPFAVGPVTGTFVLDFAFDIPGISYASDRIALDDAEGVGGVPVATHDAEDEVLDVILPVAAPGELSYSYATMYGTFDSEAALHLYPTVTIDIGGVPFAIGPFDLVVDYPLISDAVVEFPELPLMFEVPELPDVPGTTSGADTSGGESTDDGASMSDDGADESTSSTTSTGTSDDTGGIPANPGEDAGTGCGCGSQPAAPMGWLALVLFGVTRRRRTVSSRAQSL